MCRKMKISVMELCSFMTNLFIFIKILMKIVIILALSNIICGVYICNVPFHGVRMGGGRENTSYSLGEYINFNIVRCYVYVTNRRGSIFRQRFTKCR